MEKTLNDLDVIIDFDKGMAKVEAAVTPKMAETWIRTNTKELEKVVGKYYLDYSKAISDEKYHYFHLTPAWVRSQDLICEHEADEEGFCKKCGLIYGSD